MTDRASLRRPLTAKRLEAAALRYLERFASSAENLRRVLQRRVQRATAEGRCEVPDAAGWIDGLIARWQQSGLLNDTAFAESRLVSLRRKGRSTQVIRQTLRAKGVKAEIVDDILAEDEATTGGNANLMAAAALARRRRLGPYRPDGGKSEGALGDTERAQQRNRALGVMARAGFDRQTALRIIDAPDVDALLDDIGNER